MRPIQDLLPLVIPQRWTAYELRDEICKDRPNKDHRWRPSVKRVSNMLKLQANLGRLAVRREIKNNRLVVWYEGPPEVFNDIRHRA